MLPDQLELDSAYAVITAWGPSMRIPRRERLAQIFSTLAPEEFESVLNQLDAVDTTVWELAQLGAESKLGTQKLVESLQTRHPFLRNEGLQRAVFLANYYAWHEGYAQS